MASQPNITNYFNSKKRPGSTNIKRSAKVLVLEAEQCVKIAAKEISGTKPRVVFQEAKRTHTQTSSVVSKQLSNTKKTATSNKRNNKKTTPLNKDNLKQSVLTDFAKKSIETASVSSASGTEKADDTKNEESTESVDPSRTISNVPTSLDIAATSQPHSPSKVPNSPVAQAIAKLKASLANEPAPKLSMPSQELSPFRTPGSPAVRLNSPSRSMMMIMSIKEKKLGTPRSLNFDDCPPKKDESKEKTPVKAANSVKNMSIPEISAKLKASSRIDELKAKLSSFKSKDRELQLHSLDMKKVEEETKSDIKKVPYASPKKSTVLLSPGKNISSRHPEWHRLHALAEARTVTLPLPAHYRCLHEFFVAMEFVSSMMLNRKETVTFSKLKPALKKITRLNFTEKHLAQILHLYPSAYTCRLEKRSTLALTGKPDQYELVINPSYDKVDNEGAEDNRKQDKVTAQLQRQNEFKLLLIEKVKDYHQVFLSHLDPPMEVDRNKLTHWHPVFDAESIPGVETVLLPQPPNQEKITSAREFLDQTRSLMACNNRMRAALEKRANESSAKLDNETQQNNSQQASTSTTNINTTPLNPALRGIPLALIEKIRAKEKARLVEAMTRTPEEDNRQRKLLHLPEVAYILRSVFITEKKKVLPLTTVLESVVFSYKKKITKDECDELLKMIEEHAPEFIQRLSARNSFFIRLDKDVILKDVTVRLESLITPIIP